jgi:Zn-dependent protease with chaperone function
MAIDDLYPPAPADVPANLTRPDAAYRLRVVAMIGGLFLFLLLYLVFIAAAGLLAYWLVTLPVSDTTRRGFNAIVVIQVGGVLAAALLCLFLVKGLFKGGRVERSTYLTADEADHPDLFAFIRRVYLDTGAPPPRRVCISPDVNAALVYNTSLVNLVIPPRKDLLIGLGLVNVVTLAEFKAVLAHEFGHFAQRSAGLGSYLYVANRVLSDVIYGRDALDRFVDDWARQDLRVSFPAWGLKGVLWVVRKILGGTYRGINLLHLALSRRLEYNADNVAVSVSGSDAVVHSLARLPFANECLADAARSLDAAADHGLFSDDLLYHQTRAAGRLRRLRKDDRAGLPPDLPDDPGQRVQVFQPVDDGIPDRDRSHPTDHMRERNAKRIYIRSPRDDRSPWLLFGDVAGLKRRATERFYQHVLNRREDYAPRPAAEVQAFIDAEHAELTYDPRYHGLYDDRFINPGEVKDLPAEPWPREELAAWLADWPPVGLEKQVQAHRERQGEANLLRGLKTGELTLKGKTFKFRERECTIKDVERLFAEVDKELGGDLEAFAQLDRKCLLAHWSMARRLDRAGGDGMPREAELLERYRFHLAVQGLLSGLMGEHARLRAVVDVIRKNPQLEARDFQQVCAMLRGIHQSLTVNLDDAKGFTAPPLTNVPAGWSLYSLIVDRGDTDLPPLDGGMISGEWIGKLCTRLDGVLVRVKRAHFKSLGGLLAGQERLVADWQSSPALRGERAPAESVP